MNALIRVGLAAAAGIAVAVSVATPAFAAADPAAAASGSVLYAFHTPYVYPDPNVHSGSAQLRAAMTASYTGCDPTGMMACQWQAIAQATPNGCQHDPLTNGDGYFFLWISPIQNANGTVSSGEKTIRIGTPNELEVDKICFYVLGPQPPSDVFVWAALVDVQAIDPEPVGPPPLVLTRHLARKAARQLLRSARPSWHEASHKQLRCQESGTNAYSCTAEWRYKRTRYSERITVTIEDSSAVARFG
jgi:hypothetical protein